MAAKSQLNISPPNLNECSDYESYIKMLDIWRKITEVEREKHGLIIAYSLPNKSEKFGDKLRERLLATVSTARLEGADGLKAVLEYLNKILGKDDKTTKLDSFLALDDCFKKPEQSIKDYVQEFDEHVDKCKALGMKFFEEHLAYLMMKRAKLNKEQYLLIKATIDLKDEKNLYSNVKKKLIEMLTDSMGNVVDDKQDSRMKLEPTFLAEHEDVLAAYGYVKKKFVNKKFNKQTGKHDKKGQINPIGDNGKPLLCIRCGSYRHLLKSCPHSYENMSKAEKSKNKKQVHTVEVDTETTTEDTDSDDDERFCLFTTNDQELSRFTSEAINCAALDTCCTSTVCGEKWMKIYQKSMPVHMKSQMQGPFGTNRKYVFGNEGVLSGKERYLLPIMLGGYETSVEVDVIKSDIPMLLAKKDMKKAGMIIDTATDKALIQGSTVDLKTTSAGHYVVDLLERD